VLYPDAEANPIALRHLAVERALDEAGLNRTFVRPGYFATNAPRWWQSIRTGRVLRTAFPEAVTSPVHERDIAQVAVRALLDDTHRGAACPVLGAGPVTVREQVAAALGEQVRLEEVDVDTYRALLLTHSCPGRSSSSASSGPAGACPRCQPSWPPTRCPRSWAAPR
jgi:uncharacterized protein YbjT (DUF2867 family)